MLREKLEADNNEHTEYHLSEQSADEAVLLFMDGILLEPNIDYNINKHNNINLTTSARNHRLVAVYNVMGA